MNEQIRKMARLIFDFDEVENNEMKIAKWLYDNGCRIINEDEIYMSKEEWKHRAYENAMQNELCKKCRDMIAKETVPVAMYELAKAFHDEKCAEFELLSYQYNKLKDEKNEKIASEIADYIAQARKETAEKFYNLSEEFGGGIAYWHQFRKLAKQLGVEVEE